MLSQSFILVLWLCTFTLVSGQVKSCGDAHDADAPDADFHVGDDFVFYKCRKGHVMVSRTNHRNCLVEGWDNVIPVCEEIRCEAPEITNGTVIGTMGDYEETQGLNYSCHSGYMHPDRGLPAPACLHTGHRAVWNPTPQCIVIRCEVPQIENGRVFGHQGQYKENQSLSYYCNIRYKKAQVGSPLCTKAGDGADWSPTPGCEEIKCELGLAPTRGSTYAPADKTVFLPEETVRVDCAPEYWTIGTHESSDIVTCREGGGWSSTPGCEEKTCGDPHDSLVSSPQTWWRKNLRATQYYICRRGYKAMAQYATCTKAGWTPNPLCEEIICDLPLIPNAVITNPKSRYHHNDRLAYSCKRFYKPMGLPIATCEENGWDNIMTCSEIKCELGLAPTRGSTYAPADKTVFLPEETVRVDCAPEYWTIGTHESSDTVTCREGGGWSSTPGCEEITCGDPHDSLVSYPRVWRESRLRESQYYTCKRGYQRQPHATCTAAGWTPSPLCEKVQVGVR